jgi:hypothetical protein
MARVFISYASQDRTFVARLAQALESEDHSIWYDRDIRAGQRFSDEIARELDAAQVVVVVWSAHAAQSTWVRDEAGRANSQRKLLPVTLTKDATPLGFGATHAVSFEDFDGRLDHPAVRQVLGGIDTIAAPAPADSRGLLAIGGQIGTTGLIVGLVAGGLLSALHLLKATRPDAAVLVIEQLAFALPAALLTSALSSWYQRRKGLRGNRALFDALTRCLVVGLFITLAVWGMVQAGRSPNVPTGSEDPWSSAIMIVFGTVLLAPLIALLRLMLSFRRR